MDVFGGGTRSVDGGESTWRRDAQGTSGDHPGAEGTIAPPVINLPKGGGAIRGIGEKFAANPVTGTGSMTVPIATSPGRQGFGPQLTLSYDSAAGNGPFGLGWSLSLPSITRKTEKGVPKYVDVAESDVFILSGSEDLVPVLEADGSRHCDEATVAGDRYKIHRFRPRIEGLFARIERWTRDDGDVHWRSISKDNALTIYGKDEDSRVADPDDSRRIFSWLICEARDDMGNAVLYDYKREDGVGVVLSRASERNRGDSDDPRRTVNRYIKRIRYGNRVSLLDDAGRRPHLLSDLPAAQVEGADWMFEVLFDYGDHDPHLPTPAASTEWDFRADPFSTYRAGFEVRTTRLCQRVLMFHHFEHEPNVGNDCLVRSTDFTYSHEEHPTSSRNPVYTFLNTVTQVGYMRDGAGYARQSLPSVVFEYTEPVVQDVVEEVDVASLENLPVGLDGASYRWTDLHGEGIPGILTEGAGGWLYKRNLSPLHENRPEFAPTELVDMHPNLSPAGGAQFMDLAGDGQPDLVMLDRPTPGLFEHDGAEGWQPFRSLSSVLDRQTQDPNMQLVDLDGDGHADVLVTEEDTFVWHPSLAEAGFGPAQRVTQAADEEKGPRLVLADGTQSIHLADLTGDGLTDLVRIRNGEVCYWPNLGYGRFGAKVTMDDSPHFDAPDQFDQRRIRLADIDGTGTTDIIYLHREGVRLYFNQSGNGWSQPQVLGVFPWIDELVSIMPADLLGNGTACLVWSSPLPADQGRPMRYVNLMGKAKPHLLVRTINNLGAETKVKYAPSTKFYLQDRLAGKPWISRLPFPVHVVERVETYDQISRNRVVTRYGYHHGYFDGEEREFRGFGMVEQWDTESFSEFAEERLFPVGANHLDEGSHVPPVYTKTWFHTGFFMKRDHISRLYSDGYYQGDPDAWLLADTELPDGLTTEERREACRALKGRMLRQEVYGLDSTGRQDHPYSVVEAKPFIRREQPRSSQRHAVFYVCDCETLTYHYERNPADPRITHTHTLEVDQYGNVRKAATVAYPRQGSGHPDQQQQMLVTYTESDLIHLDSTAETLRTGLPFEQRSYEIQGLPFPGLWEKEALAAAIASPPEAPHTSSPGDSPQRRLFGRTRIRYYSDTLDGYLPWGEAGSRGIPYETYRLAFTQETLDQPELGRRITPELLLEGQYRNDIDGDSTHWWIPSGRQLFDPERAMQMFYLPSGVRDPFNAVSTLEFDAPNFLLPIRTEDPVENVSSADNDYRVLAPYRLTGPNGNRSQVAFDALGMVIATAVMGKEGETDPERKGESLDPYHRVPIPLAGEVPGDAIPDIISDPHRYLQDATTFFHYDVFAWQRDSAPAVALGVAREVHKPLEGETPSPVQLSLSYSDGFGRTILTKAQAEDGPAPLYDADGALVLDPDGHPQTAWSTDRWVGNGATVFNNKRLPVRQFEPFFDSRPGFTDEDALVKIGVTPTLHYDPLGRTIRTDLPDGSFSRVDFDPWQQIRYDPNDTVRDSDWYAAKASAEATGAERDAAAKASAHHDTPIRTYLDTLGRPFVTVANNIRDGTDEFIPTRTELDIEGNPLVIYDGRRCEGLTLEQAIRHRGNTVMAYTYAMGGLPLHQNSMDAGQRWTLANVAGNPIHGWDLRDDHGDGRGHQVRTKYDLLQRPTHQYVETPRADGGTDTMLAERIVYGEELSVEGRRWNLRGHVHLHYDGAGLVKNTSFDFKENLLESQRRLAIQYRTTPDWSALNSLAVEALELSALLEEETFTTTARYDALNRPIEVTTPDASIHIPGYNKANLLEHVKVRLRGVDTPTDFVTHIDYNARGQRASIAYGNGVHTTYRYDEQTFRLVRMHTTQVSGTNDLQNLHYTYDSVGNITETRDDAIEPVFFRNELVEARNRYNYDALYRLTEATGRESAIASDVPTHQEIQQVTSIPAHDHALRNYTQRYDYDPVGNILSLHHRANGGTSARIYDHEYDNNRLRAHNLPSGAIATFSHDGNGNLLTMPHIPRMEWDHNDQLRHVGIATGQEVFFTYNSDGQRMRKVWIHGDFRDERIYLGSFELYRRYRTSGPDLQEELETVHIMDDDARICMAESPTIQDAVPVDAVRTHIRYQLNNHLGSATVEVDDSDPVRVITYEEYHPYGTAAYHARNSIQVSRKRYRYTGMERDEETGLGYHTARYYAPWLGRWCSTDPVGLRDGINLYAYVGGRPTLFRDVNGTTGRSNGGRWIDPTLPPDRDDPETATDTGEGNTSGETDWCAGPNGGNRCRATEDIRIRRPDFLDPGREPERVRSRTSPAEGEQTGAGSQTPESTTIEASERDEPSVQPQSPGGNIEHAAGPESSNPVNAGASAVVTHDSHLRSRYLKAVKTRSVRSLTAISRAQALDDVGGAWRQATQASEFRNATRQATQRRLSAGGRAFSQAVDRSIPVADRARIFGLRELTESRTPASRGTLYAIATSLAEGAGRSNTVVSKFTRIGRVAGPVGIAAGVAVAGYNIAQTPEGGRGRVAAREAGQALGGAIGYILGMMAGVALAAGIVAFLAAVGVVVSAGAVAMISIGVGLALAVAGAWAFGNVVAGLFEWAYGLI